MNRERKQVITIKILGKEQMNKKMSNIEKLFSNYKREYEKINLDWYNEVGKEIRYNNKIKKLKNL